MYLVRRSRIDACPEWASPAALHGLGETPPLAKQVYAAQSRIRELTDRGFQNIFYDRDKVIVVAFWADTCRPCDTVAATMTSVAEKIAQGPHAQRVKFYHAQWDPAVNPRLHRQYGFVKIPVVFFYYTGTGRQPTRADPLLESSAGGDRFEADAGTYLRRIEGILRRHGHIAPDTTIAQSRGWTNSHAMIDHDDLEDVDRMLVAPSRVQKYLEPLSRANPQARLSKVAKILVPSSFNLEFQRITNQAATGDDMGTVDRARRLVYLLSVRRLQVYLNSAVHEAVHFFTCPMKGRFSDFYLNYGIGITEGFTQLVTEEILKAQKVAIKQPPYDIERALAAKLVEVVGFDAVAEDFFRCTKNVHKALEPSRTFGALVALRKEAEAARSDALRVQKYREIIRLLDRLPRPAR